MPQKMSKRSEDQTTLPDLPDLNLGPVLLLSDHLLEKKLETIKIRHPKTGKLASFFQCRDTCQFYEIHKFDDGFRSWMLKDVVLKDGSLHIMTQVNSFFLILPYLLKNEGRYMQLEAILHDNDTPTIHTLSPSYFKSLSSLCLTKEVEGGLYYMYDKAKSIEWLKLKTQKLGEMLRRGRVSTSTTASILPGFEASVDQKVCQEESLRYACQLMSEYLNGHMAEQLRSALEIQLLLKEKRVSPSEDGPLKKKIKIEGPIEDYSTGETLLLKKVVKLTAAQKRLNKVDKEGIKNISSFFSKPLKK